MGLQEFFRGPMPADRELDAAVAREVMGWREGNRGRGDLGWVRPDGSQRLLPPNWSTDIAAAFEVVEKMEQAGWATTLESDGTLRWNAAFWMGDDYHCSGYGNALPKAICLAALAAVRSEPGGEGP